MKSAVAGLAIGAVGAAVDRRGGDYHGLELFGAGAALAVAAGATPGALDGHHGSAVLKNGAAGTAVGLLAGAALGFLAYQGIHAIADAITGNDNTTEEAPGPLGKRPAVRGTIV